MACTSAAFHRLRCNSAPHLRVAADQANRIHLFTNAPLNYFTASEINQAIILSTESFMVRVGERLGGVAFT